VPDSVQNPSPDDDTKPRCQECLGDAEKGGEIVPDEEPVRRRWGFCAFGDGWSWCNTFQRFKRR
jgi:hypothetical protein